MDVKRVSASLTPVENRIIMFMHFIFFFTFSLRPATEGVDTEGREIPKIKKSRIKTLFFDQPFFEFRNFGNKILNRRYFMIEFRKY